MDKKKKPIKIEGVTADGKKFRPSDWAQRMSGRLASFKDRRLRYSPLLSLSHDENGYQCILLDPELKKKGPTLYESILEFARKNNLKICK